MKKSHGKCRWGSGLILLSAFVAEVLAIPGSYHSTLGPSYFPDYTVPGAKPYPFDATRPLELRVRSYLDANCSRCHQPGGIKNGGMDFRYSTPLNRTALFARSSRLSPDGRNLYHIQPGHPENSEVYLRLASVGSYAMPPMGRTRVDEKALALLRDWIQSLSRDAQPRATVVGERKSPYILNRSQRELEIRGTDLGFDSSPVPQLAVEVFDSRSEPIPGISVSAGENPLRHGWMLRWAHPFPRGRYWLRMRWGSGIRAQALLVL